jgi:hypothetical protein
MSAEMTIFSTNINARSADFQTFFNGGGGILALAGGANRATYYNFVPLTGLTAAAVSPPFTVTAAGTALGVTTTMANCCKTHNAFAIPAAPFVVLEDDSSSLAETIAAFDVVIGGGGFETPTTTGPTTTAHASTTTTAAAAPKAAAVAAAPAFTG